MRGSNPRPLAHKTNTLPTELMEHVCRSWLPASLKVAESRVRGLVVMIVACQVMDPGSIPGERIFFITFFTHLAWCLPGMGWNRPRFILLPVGLQLKTILPLFSPSCYKKSHYLHTVPAYTLDRPYSSQKKRDPRNRSRTNDLEISIVAIYSLPLCQLSYTRTYGLVAAGGQK